MGGKMATHHLIDQGYQHIAHLSGPLDWWEARQRKQGWQNALADQGIAESEMVSAEGNWSSASGEQVILQMLDEYPTMDAIFVANDQMALSVLQVACRKEIRVPQDLAVVGFDGLQEAAYYWPPLTTVYQDQHRLGCCAVTEVVQIIESEEENKSAIEPLEKWIEPELIIRQSSIAR
jgi:DNA-binding LacI/PurR family transcriptional regulator